MRRIDLHIHTISTVLDREFDFDIGVIEEYVSINNLDCIAITNHNVFNREQYQMISERLKITVLPGIEISLERGHLLVIAPISELSSFTTQCAEIEGKIRNQNDNITIEAFREIFPLVNRYLLIPHYDKQPVLARSIISEYRKDIVCGEVQSYKKFIYMIRQTDELTPVLFSDFRACVQHDTFPNRFTYIDIDEISVPALKEALLDKTKVSLSSEKSHNLIQVLSNGLKISTGLTVILGGRSSGKTYTLDAIAREIDNVKYIKQFDLLSSSNEVDETKFDNCIRGQQDEEAKKFLKPFESVVENIRTISLKNNDELLVEYVQKLLQVGAEADRDDAYSKAKLFHETPFDIQDQLELIELIKSILLILENKKYSDFISKYIDRTVLASLAVELMKQYSSEKELALKTSYANDIIEAIKNELRLKTASQSIPDFDFYKYLMDKHKVKTFIDIVIAIKNRRVICDRQIASYTVRIEVRPYNSVNEVRTFNRQSAALSTAFQFYNSPYEYLLNLLNIHNILPSELYKYFVYIEGTVLNEHGFSASGGERSEFNLLKQLDDASQHDILLIDEPESSFDNLFINSNINKMLKDLAQFMPVVVSTHNNTIGASIKPNYIVFTQRNILPTGQVEYCIYSGHPMNHELVSLEGRKIENHLVMLNCLEAGESIYKDRSEFYENLKN